MAKKSEKVIMATKDLSNLKKNTPRVKKLGKRASKTIAVKA